MATPERLTVTMTGRPPVKIRTAEWPVIASLNGHLAPEGTDPAEIKKLLELHHVNKFRVRVRRHQDGRALVYVMVSTAAGPGGISGGELLPSQPQPFSGTALVSAITRVCASCGVPERFAQQVIAALPAEQI